MWNLKNRNTDTEHRAVITKGDGGEGRGNKAKVGQVSGDHWKLNFGCEYTVLNTEVDI